MDCIKLGNMLRELRVKNNMTQKELADRLCLSDKAISKWERGLACPDIFLLSDLCDILNIDINLLLNGNESQEKIKGGNMKNTKYYICPDCGSLTFSTGDTQVYCCNHKLDYTEAKKAEESQKLKAEAVENEWYITSEHPMTKDDYIEFVAFVSSEAMEIVKLYPEWNVSLRLQRMGHGKLLFFSKKEGLLYQLI